MYESNSLRQHAGVVIYHDGLGFDLFVHLLSQLVGFVHIPMPEILVQHIALTLLSNIIVHCICCLLLKSVCLLGTVHLCLLHLCLCLCTCCQGYTNT